MKSGGEIKSSVITLTYQSVIRMLWILTAVFVPIFGVSFGHFKVGFISLSPSVVFIFLILYVAAFRFFLGHPLIPREVSLRSYRGLAVLLATFVILHVLSLMHSILIQSDWLNVWGTKNMVKIFFGVILFWLTLIFFPRDEKLIGRFFLVSGIALACLLAIFIHKYAIVSHMVFLSTDYYGFATTGKNQVAVQTVFFFFYLFSFFLLSKRRWSILPFLLILIVSILYLQSRMGWAAAFFGYIYLIGCVWRNNPKMGIKLFLKSLLIALVMGALVLVFISQYIDLTNMFLRLLSIFNPESLTEAQSYIGKNSYEVRGHTILEAMNGFYASPLIGSGLGNTFNYIERPTHNDYVTLLVELGVFGEILFLWILWNIWKRGSSHPRVNSQNIKWLPMASHAGFLVLLICLNFYNMYLSPYFWIYLALYIVTAETMNKDGMVVQNA